MSLIDDDVPAVTVQFGAASYTATEGGTMATVEVTLSAAPERTVVVPLSVTPAGEASSTDYTLSEMSLTFTSGETSATFTVTADEDMVDDDDESITIGFGTLPSGVTAVGTTTTTVSLIDDDVPAVTVQFGAAAYTATEGGTMATVEVTLSADPERTVVGRCRSPGERVVTATDYTVSRYVADVHQRRRRRRATFTVTADEDIPSAPDSGASPPHAVTVTVRTTTASRSRSGSARCPAG